MKKRIAAIITVCIFGITGILGGLPFNRAQEVRAAQTDSEVRAIWLAYVDFSSLGLKTNSESVFRSKASSFLSKAKTNNINTVYFHVRAFDDAAWKSKTFKASSYLTSKAKSGKTAADTYSFDPLKVMVELTHAKGMELHAWMNPYRIDMNYYWNPAYASSTKRIQIAVKEVMAYDVDGIHFDDYFYHAKKGYKNRDNKNILSVSKDPSAKNKRKYVNKMVKAVYSTVKAENSKAQFGISPQGNLDNCRSAGADIDAWLSDDGYLDYIVPQIYWTDQWGSSGKTSMYSDRLKAWTKLNKNGADMYIGLASYRTGITASDDPGWSRKSTNLATQLNLLRAGGCEGYALFSAKDLYRSGAQDELNYLNKMVKRIPRLGTSYETYNTVKVKWNKIDGVSGYQIYRADSKDGTYRKIKTAGSGTSSYKDTGLEAGKRYYYKVRAYSGTKTHPFSAVHYRKALPQTPSVSTKAGKKQITVSWKAVPEVTGYEVYRTKTKGGKYGRVKKVGSTTTKFVNKKLTKGRTYYYKVRAYKTVNGKNVYGNFSAVSSRKSK